ncbi:glycosyltransferase [Pseudactinotalea sp. HY160]|uniref:glycosyltransferase n=1 Tax=Pseudactinotalea sp. HY160 TaxID=2654490 RepID=UPI00128C5729|nr:glycosyltransferase [Pseudactinotalea sp. HY160]
MRIADLIASAFKLRAVRGAGRLAWQGHTWIPARAADRVEASRHFAQLYADHGYHGDAARIYGLAAARAGDSASRTQLEAGRVLAELDAGLVPADLPAVQRRVLGAADAALAGGDVDVTARRLTSALAIAFHPTRHLLTEPSPLLVDTEAFLRPLHDSVALTTLTSDAPGPATERAGARERPEPTERLLVLVADQPSMVRPMVERHRAAGREVRLIDLGAIEEADLTLAALVAARLDHSLTGARIPVPAALADSLAWADTIFVEWGHRALVWASLLDTRLPIVTRVRKYEAMTPMPLLTAWQHLGRSVFVATPIRDLVAATAPGFGSDVHVVPDAVDLPRWDRGKRAEADRTIALVGWNKVSKDPAWALEVLRLLREEDPTWRLLLVGETVPADSGADPYYEALTRRILGFKDAVEVTGFTDDLAATLTRVGVILSSSRVEGQHDSLIQGVASGALPVVRDWPDLAAWGGAAAVYPAEWVVGTPQLAAERILTAAPTPARSEATRLAREWVRREYDPAALTAAFDGVVLDGDRPARRTRRRPHARRAATDRT